jgi:hypothetical protein
VTELKSVPFLVGITGHRDLPDDDQAAVSNTVTDVLRHYQAAMPNTDIALVSGLAIGADQIAAEAALRIPGVHVIAVLPMPLDEYRRDFREADLERFDATLAQCSGVIDTSMFMEGPPGEGPEYRNALYQNAGRFIARNCPVLIAAWDGLPPEFVGGTADVIYFKCAGLIPLRSRFVEFDESPEDPGIVLHIPVSRVSGASHHNAGVGLVQLTHDGLPHRWDRNVDFDAVSLNTLNRTVGDSSFASKTSVTQRLLNASDSIAVELQIRYRRLLKTLLFSGVLALTLVALMQTIEGRWPALPAAVGIVFLGSLWWYFQRSALKARFQGMRALAEGARVQFVWQQSGIPKSVAEDYLAGQTGAATWIRQTLRGAYVADQATPQRRDVRVAPEWMHEQVSYFRGSPDRPGAIERSHRKAVTLRRRALVFGGAAVIALIADIAIVAGDLVVPEWLRLVMQMIWAVGAAATIALVSYSEIMGFKELAARYSVAVPIFEQGEIELARLKNTPGATESDVRNVAQVVGRRALRESGDWFALQAGREVRPV